MIAVGLSFFNLQAQSNDFEGKVMLRINGHDHTLPDDIVNEFDKSWKEYRDYFERDMIGMGNDDAKVTGGHLNNKIAKLTFQKGVDDKQVKIKIKMKITNNRLRLNLRYINWFWLTGTRRSRQILI